MDKKGLTIDVLTLFPEMFRPVTEDSILGRAAEKGLIDVRLTNIRDFSNDKHNRADDYPFGGGGGMVMMADPIFGAMEHVMNVLPPIIAFSPITVSPPRIEALAYIVTPSPIVGWRFLPESF